MTASKRHSIEDIRTNPAVPGIAPWSEFIRFAESLGEDIGPGFGRDAARVGRYVNALEEQLEAAHEALRGIERYAYDAIRDGHPSIPEMTVVQQRAMRAITSNPAKRPKGEGATYRWWYAARRAPGTLQPSVWLESDGPNLSRVCNHRYMWAARVCAWWRNRRADLLDGAA